MSGNKRYYWLKLNENFFEDDTIQWLEEQENGKDYVIFYLKLCLKSLSDDGKLIRYVGERLIPYDIKALAKLTNTYPDTVAVAMKSFLEIGLIEQLDTGEICMKQIDEMIGSETDSARRMRKKRLLDNRKQELLNVPSQCDNDVQKCDTEIEKEKELDKEIEQEPEGNNNVAAVQNVANIYQENFGVLSPIVLQNLEAWEKDIGTELVIEAMTRAKKNQKPYAYAEGIMKNWVNNNVKSLEDVYAQDMEHQNRKFNNRPNKQQARTEPVPDWVNEETKKETVVDEDLQKEFEERLKRIGEMGAN